jgi:1-deoxy-D-xylulose-5-phosphate synthase
MLFTALHHDGPIAIRYPRGNGPGVALKAKPALIPIGKAEVVKHGTQAVILGLGALLPMALEVAKELEARGFSVAVINPARSSRSTATPSRSSPAAPTWSSPWKTTSWPADSAAPCWRNWPTRGLQTPVVRIGWPDNFIEHGKPDALRAKYGISVAATVEKTLPYLKKWLLSPERWGCD